MAKFVFVILHYNTLLETHDCVASIRNHVSGSNYHIIIVDNFSPNRTGLELKDEYATTSDVTVILNNKNLGFAKGNNVGFKYAKEVLNADFIILMNNDTELVEDTFVSIIEEEYKFSNFALLGPLEIIPEPPYHRKHEGKKNVTISRCMRSILLLSIYYLLSFVGLDIYIRRKFGNKSEKAIQSITEEPQIREENVQLHGFFWIFSPQYIRLNDGINPKTFLYREEELLFLRLKKQHLKSVYLPSLKIKHKCSKATSSLFKKESQFRRFFYYHAIKSTIVLLKELFP